MKKIFLFSLIAFNSLAFCHSSSDNFKLKIQNINDYSFELTIYSALNGPLKKTDSFEVNSSLFNDQLSTFSTNELTITQQTQFAVCQENPNLSGWSTFHKFKISAQGKLKYSRVADYPTEICLIHLEEINP